MCKGEERTLTRQEGPGRSAPAAEAIASGGEHGAAELAPAAVASCGTAEPGCGAVECVAAPEGEALEGGVLGRCPWCGSTDVLLGMFRDSRGTLFYLVRCRRCAHGTDPSREKEEALRMWRVRRHPPCMYCGRPVSVHHVLGSQISYDCRHCDIRMTVESRFADLGPY